MRAGGPEDVRRGAPRHQAERAGVAEAAAAASASGRRGADVWQTDGQASPAVRRGLLHSVGRGGGRGRFRVGLGAVRAGRAVPVAVGGACRRRRAAAAARASPAEGGHHPSPHFQSPSSSPSSSSPSSSSPLASPPPAAPCPPAARATPSRGPCLPLCQVGPSLSDHAFGLVATHLPGRTGAECASRWALLRGAPAAKSKSAK